MTILGIGIDVLHLPRLYALVNRRGATATATRRSTLTESNEKFSSNAPPGQHLALALAQDKLARRILGREELGEFRSLLVERGAEVGKEGGYEIGMRYLAVRWTAKEAAFKALYPHTTLSWKDVQVLKRPSPSAGASASDRGGRKPYIHLNRTTLQNTTPAAILDSLSMHLSVSHDADYVASVVVAESK